jgi:hypothetical protein
VVVREPGGRPTKEIIITAGLNVYLSEVQSVLREQRSVVDLTSWACPGRWRRARRGRRCPRARSPLDLDGACAYAIVGNHVAGRRMTASESTTSTLKLR